MNEHVGVTLDVLPGTLGGLTAALGGFNELVAATSMLTTAIGRSTSAVDAMMLTLGVGVAGLGFEAAKAFGEVERSMKIVQSVSGQTSSEINVLTQQANELSVKYKMGIDEITDGLTTLGRAGLSSVNTQLDTMKAGLEAAKITGLQLDDVLNKIVQTTALLGGDINSSSFGYQSQELTSKIIATSQTAPIDMNDVVQTLSYSGGTAAAGGINIQNEDALYDYLGTIAAFGQKGVSGSMAGTALRAFFTKPASQSSQVTEALGRLDMKPEDLWEDGGNKIRPVSEQIELIQKQMDKLKISQIDQIELWGKIVSPKMGQQMLKLNADSIRDLTEKIKQTDSAEALAQNTMNNFMSDLHTLSEQGQKAWREYGEAALVWISPVVKGISGLMNLLDTDVGGFPIFQQFIKGGIILIISQIIIRLGSVWNLIKGIGTEVKSQLNGFSQVHRTEEQIVADLQRQYREMGLTDAQAERLAKESQNTHRNLGTSVKVLAEFLAKLNEAVGLMGRLAQLSQINSMQMIGGMTGAQYQKFYDAKTNYNEKAWYQGYYSRGDLTKTDFAKLSLRHGISQNELQQIYYGTHKKYGTGLYDYALENQSGFKSAMAKGNSAGFITATTLEKYLQQNKMGMYDPEKNPMMAIVEGIKGDTGRLANTSSAATATKTPGTSQTNSSQAKNAEKISKDQAINAEKSKQEIAEKEVTNETQVTKQLKQTGNQTERNKNEMNQLEVIAAQNRLTANQNKLKKLNEEIQLITTHQTQESAERAAIINAREQENTALMQNTNALKKQQNRLSTSENTRANLQKIINSNEEKYIINQRVINSLKQEEENQLRALQTKRNQLMTETVSLNTQLNNTTASEVKSGISSSMMSAEKAAIEAEIVAKKGEELGLSNLTTAELLELNAILGTLPNTLTARLAIEKQLEGKALEELEIQNQINGMDRAILRNKIRQAQGQGALYTPVGLGGVAQPNAAINGVPMTRFSIPLGTVPTTTQLGQGTGFMSMMRNSMLSGFSGMRNFQEGGSLRGNWFWNAGMMQMVDRNAITGATKNMGKLGKAAGALGGMFGSLGMMFGPLEIAMMAFSVAMQAIQKWHENYVKKLEEINSALSETREKIKEAEEAFLSAYEEQNPKATQDEKDEALLDAYGGDTSATKDDGLQSYRDKMYAVTAQIELNTRKQTSMELDSIWGASGDLARQEEGINETLQSAIKAEATQFLNSMTGNQQVSERIYDEIYDYINSDEMDIVQQTYDEDLKAMVPDGSEQKNTSEALMNSMHTELGLSTDRLDKTLNKYPEWIAKQEDKSDNAKYARSIMAEGIDSMGPTEGRAYEGIWGAGASGRDLAQYYKMQSEAMQLSAKDKNIIMNGINANEDFFKKMQKIYFKQSKDGKLIGTDEKTEAKILRAIQNRLGGISRAQAKIALTLAAVSEIQKVVSEQVQPTLMSHMEAAWEGVSISSGTQDQVGGTWGTTSAVQQGVSIISAQMARLLQQKAFELGSLKAEMAGIDMKDLDALRLAAMEDPNRQSVTINGTVYDKAHMSDALNIFSGMETAPYEAIALQKGESVADAKAWGEDMKKKLDENHARASAVWDTQAKGLEYYLEPIVTQAYLDSFKDSDAKATGAADTGDKDKNKDKNKDKDTSSRKNWVNLAICNKKEIPKLNVNLFKKPPNFTILNRNFKLRDVNVNTADDAKSIQNAVKNSIIEIQNRSNPKIIQDDAAEYDPVNATEGNTLPTGTKKTE